jgi:phosphatidylinositol-3-phosphatase
MCPGPVSNRGHKRRQVSLLRHFPYDPHPWVCAGLLPVFFVRSPAISPLQALLMVNPVESLEPRLLFSVLPAIPRPDHVVVLIEEDHSYSQILGGPLLPREIWPVQLPSLLDIAPHMRQLADHSASFTQAFSVGNNNFLDYQALFSGYVPKQQEAPPGSPLTDPNLASELNAAGLSFGGYAEGLPRAGYIGSDKGDYTRSHNPWVEFSNVPATENLPFARFPRHYAALPTVSYVVPNEQNNMHSGQVQDADNWYQSNIAPYANWAMSHNSLLVVTWDESHQSNDQIPTLFYGPMVRRGQYSEHITQRNILATIQDMYGLAPTGASASATPITDIFATRAQAGAGKFRAAGFGQIVGSVAIGGPVGGPVGGSRAGWKVYLDLNHNGIFDRREPHATTGAGGQFHFDHLPAGEYTVHLAPRAGYGPVPSTGDSFPVSLIGGQKITDLVFSEIRVV